MAANPDERAEPVLKAHDSSVADSVAYAPPTQQMPIPGHMMMQPPPMSQPPPMVNQQPWFEAMTMDWFYKDRFSKIESFDWSSHKRVKIYFVNHG